MSPRNFPIKSMTLFLDLNLPHSSSVYYSICIALQYSISLEPISTVFPSIFLDLNQNMPPCFWEQLPSSKCKCCEQPRAPFRSWVPLLTFWKFCKKHLYFYKSCELCIFKKTNCCCWNFVFFWRNVRACEQSWWQLPKSTHAIMTLISAKSKTNLPVREMVGGYL